jgi:hypothetical protein
MIQLERHVNPCPQWNNFHLPCQVAALELEKTTLEGERAEVPAETGQLQEQVESLPLDSVSVNTAEEQASEVVFASQLTYVVTS